MRAANDVADARKRLNTLGMNQISRDTHQLSVRKAQNAAKPKKPKHSPKVRNWYDQSAS